MIVGSIDRELTQDRNGRLDLYEQDNDIKMAAAIGATTVIVQVTCEMWVVPLFRHFHPQANASK